MMKKNFKSLEYHRSFACIDLSAVKHNFDTLKASLAPDVKTMAVVKANAYGHGAVRISKALQGRADYFAVGVIEEALELRDNGITEPIVILSYTSSLQYETLINNNLIPTIYSYDDAVKLSQTAVSLKKICTVHLAVDTGMNRIGFKDDEQSAEIIKNICKLCNLNIEGLFTHFACADCEDKTSALIQKNRFDAFIAMLEEKGVNIPLKHSSNSAAIIDLDCNYNMVRMGIALYGLYPSEDVKKIDIMPAMDVISHIIHIKDVEAGVGIGYGHAYVTPEKRRIATVCIGYADGFNRNLSNKGYLLVHGKKAPVVGRVCMDQIMVDVTDIDNVLVGDLAVIMGSDEGTYLSAEELGAMCDSFNYEIICTFMPRVIRVYFENGEIV